ncbi:GTP cyclohydrolase, FolE2/MptA family [Marinobacterium aestuariivivens]|uniref:GTP cyclohydrolase, FolE2/MptA family n=1 Tax=Marinobacterium aestuariivivens TaxID=1698799 RepID=A0ABW2A3E2_9GAMM
MNSALNLPLPDPDSSNLPPVGGNLDAVGMSGLALPFTLAVAERGEVPCQGAASFYVSLSDPHAKGIHMSRLYLLLDAFAGSTAVTPTSLRRFLEQALCSSRSKTAPASRSPRSTTGCSTRAVAGRHRTASAPLPRSGSGWPASTLFRLSG